MVRHVRVVCECTQPSLVATCLGQQSVGYTSRSFRFDKHPALRKRGVKYGASCLAPLIYLRLAVDEYVDRSAYAMQRASQAHHLGVAVGHFGLDYEEVEIAPGARFSACVRAEKDHAHW
jgi:hypothetical protein